jgi:hypothetical protein
VGGDALPGVSSTLFADYMEVRRAKKAGKFTATAAAGILREAERAGVTVERAVQACCEYSWIGFRSDWFAERQASKPRTPPAAQSFAERDREAGMQRWEQMTGRTHPDRAPPAVVIGAGALPLDGRGIRSTRSGPRAGTRRTSRELLHNLQAKVQQEVKRASTEIAKPLSTASPSTASAKPNTGTSSASSSAPASSSTSAARSPSSSRPASSSRARSGRSQRSA